MDNSYRKEVLEEYQIGRNNISTSSNHCIISDVKDDTNFQKAMVILRQAIPSSGSGFLTCSNQIISLYYLA